LTKSELKVFLDEKVKEFNSPSFIETDPISIPKKFTKLQDIEIIGLWTAVISWGQRVTIINNGNRLVDLMDGAPHDFIMNHSEPDRKRFLKFVHRTFQPVDALYFLEFFQHYYKNHHSLEDAFLTSSEKEPIKAGLIQFRNQFFNLDSALERTQKHIASPLKNSSCKRLNMFLRWMVRQDDKGVDFGIWKSISPSQLLMPLDVHVDKVARKLNLLDRKQTDWRTVLELTEKLRKFDKKDPVKYDFALFGLGVLGVL